VTEAGLMVDRKTWFWRGRSTPEEQYSAPKASAACCLLPAACYFDRLRPPPTVITSPVM
jgi:hypothetical protein